MAPRRPYSNVSADRNPRISTPSIDRLGPPLQEQPVHRVQQEDEGQPDDEHHDDRRHWALLCPVQNGRASAVLVDLFVIQVHPAHQKTPLLLPTVSVQRARAQVTPPYGGRPQGAAQAVIRATPASTSATFGTTSSTLSCAQNRTSSSSSPARRLRAV